MEIFKLFESTIANIEPGHHNNKHLRRDQLLDNYDAASKTLQTLIKAKENEIAYRRDLVVMLERSKTNYDNKLKQAMEAYEIAKKHAPDSLNIKELTKGTKSDLDTTTSSTSSTQSVFATPSNTTPNLSNTGSQPNSSSTKNSDLDIPLPYESNENRSSLDRRLSEFLKTFPNLNQAGLASTSTNNNDVKPLPGYYTQQPPPIPAAPPMMAMLRFPPPPIVAPTVPPPHHPNINSNAQENHDTADMDLSDYEESTNNGVGSAGIIPMVASAMQQGAGGKSHIGPDPLPYVSGQQYNSPIQYTHRLNPLPFDPSIMEPRLVRESSSSSGSRDKPHSDKSSHKHSSSSGSSNSGVKHSDKSKYSSSSSQSSGRSKRR